MQIKKRLSYSFMIAASTLILSFIFPIIPCRKAPNIPNPIYKWSMCTLNSGSILQTNSTIEYFGYTTNLSSAVFTLVILISIITYLTLVLIARSNKKKRNK